MEEVDIEAVDKALKQRTIQQNKAMHLWFEHIADELNSVGFEQKITIGTVDVPWNKDTVKMLMKKIAMAQFNKPHTSELTVSELPQVAETLNRVLAEKGFHIPFPSIESLTK